MITAIKRQDAVNGLDDLFDYNASDVENIKDVESNGNMKLQKILANYYRHLCGFKCNLDDVLTPNEINEFLPLTALYSDYDSYKTYSADFLNRLIHNSYENGNNDFYLNFENLDPIMCIFKKVKARRTNPLRATIKGDVGIWLGIDAQNLEIFVKGNVGDELGWDSRNIKITIEGDVGSVFGYASNNLTASIRGDCGCGLGDYAKNAAIYVDGNVDVEPSEKLAECAIIGEDARNHHVYKRMMAEFEEKFK
jgi:hypothetical protein